jgi:hypothetical protein
MIIEFDLFLFNESNIAFKYTFKWVLVYKIESTLDFCQK